MDTIARLVTMTCNNCGKKLAELKIKDGIVSIKCNKCGTMNVQESTTTKNVKNVSSNK